MFLNNFVGNFRSLLLQIKPTALVLLLGMLGSWQTAAVEKILTQLSLSSGE